jgi:hypothetical protein
MFAREIDCRKALTHYLSSALFLFFFIIHQEILLGGFRLVTFFVRSVYSTGSQVRRQSFLAQGAPRKNDLHESSRFFLCQSKAILFIERICSVPCIWT